MSGWADAVKILAMVLAAVLVSFRTNATITAAQPRPSSCPDEPALRALAHTEWQDPAVRDLPPAPPNRPALADYRSCRDFRSCYEQDCARRPPPDSTPRDFYAASRPFVMCNQSASPAKGTLVLVHGLSDSPYTVAAIAESLSRRGYNIVTILLAGHGADSLGEESQAELRDWRAGLDHGMNFARTLFGKSGVSIGGYSTGGALALDYVRRHPDAAVENLLLFDPALALSETSERVLRPGWDGTSIAYHLAAKALGYNAKTDQPVNPSRTPLHWVDDAAPVMDLIRSLRADKSPVTTPTIAFFTNGLSESGDETIDAARSRKDLCGSDGRPGLLVRSQSKCETHADLRHNQLTIRENFGNCAASKRNPVNPRFEQLVDDVTSWLDRHAPTGASVEDPRAPAPPVVK